jgi:type II secretory ATPase GspE/PulE/Tfp pilus assembly ATPase PilB-like protein
MGMNPLNFADALLGIVAQRLVRTICSECKEAYKPDQQEFDLLVQEYGEDMFDELEINYSEDLQLQRGQGCDHCNDSGYRGRAGIHELLVHGRDPQGCRKRGHAYPQARWHKKGIRGID